MGDSTATTTLQKQSEEGQDDVSTSSYTDLGILQKVREEKEKRKKDMDANGSVMSSDSASKSLMSRHEMKMGFYTINLGNLWSVEIGS